MAMHLRGRLQTRRTPQAVAQVPANLALKCSLLPAAPAGRIPTELFVRSENNTRTARPEVQRRLGYVTNLGESTGVCPLFGTIR